MTKKVLIIDENNIEKLSNDFSKVFSVIECASTSAALSILYNEYASISSIVINDFDYMIKGLDFLNSLHLSPYFFNIPCFVIVNTDDEIMHTKILELRCAGYFVRPFIIKHLIRVVDNAIVLRESSSFTISQNTKVLAKEEMKRRNKLLDYSSISVCVIDTENYEILYVNATCAKNCGKAMEDYKRLTCYEYLRNRKTPCEDCYLKRANSTDFIKFEHTDDENNRHYVSRVKFIDWAGRHALVKYTTDETSGINLRLKLQASHRALDAASNNTGISFWRYDLDKKIAAWEDFLKTSYAGYPVRMTDTPETMIKNKWVHTDDSVVFLKMYSDLEEGAESAEATVRLLNQTTGRYNCFHIVYTRLHDVYYKTRQAIGFAENVDLQMSYKNQSDKQLQLRNEIIKDAILYYELDLTNSYLIEYQSKIDDIPSMTSNTLLTDKMKNDILNKIFEEDREYVKQHLFSDSLKREYEKGNTSYELLYRRLLQNDEVHWVCATINMMNRVYTDSVVAFICLHDVNDIEMDRQALETAINEGVESLSIINVDTGMAHLIKTSGELSNLEKYKHFNHYESIKDILKNSVIEADRVQCLEFFKIKSLVETLKRTDNAEISYTIKDKNGYTRRKCSTAYYLNDFHNEIVIVRRDITAIFEETQRQEAVLKAAAESADVANKAKGEFLSRMSHDMRTPMNAILGLTYLAKQENSIENVKEFLGNIELSSNYLLGLINDVLDLSKIETGNTVLKEEVFTLEEFTRGVDNVIVPIMNAKNITFDFRMECNIRTIITDKLRFNQIFYNLLTNACKYTHNGGNVEFVVEEIPGKEDRYGLRCRVKDNGIGISEEFLKIIFVPFTQENNPALEEQQGTGLGLAIVNNLVNLMGGKIIVNSKLGEGTEFIIDLFPKKTMNVKFADEEVKIDFTALSGKKILVVDDIELNTVIARKILELDGCIVSIADDGKTAVEAFEKSNIGYFDAIFMDVRMPNMNGLEATKVIRSLERPDAKTIPIIAMTADAFTEAINGTKEAGMNAHLTKPIEPEKIRSTLLELVSQ